MKNIKDLVLLDILQVFFWFFALVFSLITLAKINGYILYRGVSFPEGIYHLKINYHQYKKCDLVLFSTNNEIPRPHLYHYYLNQIVGADNKMAIGRILALEYDKVTLDPLIMINGHALKETPIHSNIKPLQLTGLKNNKKEYVVPSNNAIVYSNKAITVPFREIYGSIKPVFTSDKTMQMLDDFFSTQTN